MALFNLNKNSRGSQRALAALALSEALSNQSATVFNTELSSKFVGLESEGSVVPELASKLETQFDTVKGVLQSAMPDLNEVGLESATRTAMLLGDTNSLATKLKSLGLESFSSESIGNYRNQTIEVNGMVASVTGVIDTIYPIVEIGANYAGVEINLSRYVQVNAPVHTAGHDATDFDRKHIVNGYRKVDALKGEHNKLRPVIIAGDNEDLFVDPVLIATSKIEGTDMRTAPLKPITDKVNLIKLSRIPGLSDSDVMTYNDRIDEGGSLKTIYVQVGEDKSGSGGSDERALVPVSLSMYNQAQLVRGANNGATNDVNSNLDVDDLTISLSSTQAKAIPALVALADAGYSRITFSVVVNTKLNLHNGNATQTFSAMAITGIYKEGDSENHIGNGVITSELEAVKPVFAGQDFDITLSSKTIRLTGTRVDDHSLPFTFNCSAREVITADKSIQEADVNSVLDVMGATEIIEREAAAVRHLLSTIDDLDAAYGKSERTVNPEGTSMCGLTYIERPWVEVEELTLQDIVDTQKSSERFEDISAALVHLLGDRATAAMTDTNYIEAKRLYTGDKSAKAEFALVTPRAIGRYLYTEGDDRTFGALEDIAAKPKIVSTGLEVMDDTIVMVLRSSAENGTFDPWAWGNTLRSPSIVYDVQLDRSGVARHLQLQPFYEFTNNMPIVYKLKVKGLTDYLKSKSITLTDEV